MKLRHSIAAVAVAAAALSLSVAPALAATASETITGGLTTSAPDMTFAPVTLTGAATTQTGTYTLAVNDFTGSNAGWHVTIAGAALSNGGPVTLATTATPPIGAPCTVVVTGCVDLAANVAATAPFVISTTAVPLYSAAVNTGELGHNVLTPMSVAIPRERGRRDVHQHLDRLRHQWSLTTTPRCAWAMKTATRGGLLIAMALRVRRAGVAVDGRVDEVVVRGSYT